MFVLSSIRFCIDSFLHTSYEKLYLSKQSQITLIIIDMHSLYVGYA
jgi:hypothetical protein